MNTLSMLATYGAIVEMILISLLVLTTLIFKRLQYLRSQNLIETKQEIKNFILNCMRNNIPFKGNSFKNKWKKLAILLPIINDFDRNQEENIWLIVRVILLREIVLPLARKDALSANWIDRHHAALAFSLHSENSDNKYILTLINDRVPLVRYAAAAAGIKYGSSEVFNLILERMSVESWLTQSIYIKGFDGVPAATYYILEKIMTRSKDNTLMATIYNLLLKYPVFNVPWNIELDVQSKNVLLALTAMRYMTYIKKESAAPVLLDLLQDPNWKVKTVALACLGDLKMNTTIPEISACLEDDNWWTRFAAIQALKKIGKMGEIELNVQHIEYFGINVDFSQHVLNTF